MRKGTALCQSSEKSITKKPSVKKKKSEAARKGLEILEHIKSFLTSRHGESPQLSKIRKTDFPKEVREMTIKDNKLMADFKKQKRRQTKDRNS